MNDRTVLTDLILANPTLVDIATADLLAFYNAYQERPLKAFRNRAQAEERCFALVAELTAVEDTPEAVDEPSEVILEEIIEEAAQEQSLLGALVAQVVAEPTAEPAMVSLADICARLQIVPRIARRRLRKARGTLTEGRWEFTPEQVAEVESILTGTVAAE